MRATILVGILLLFAIVIEIAWTNRRNVAFIKDGLWFGFIFVIIVIAISVPIYYILDAQAEKNGIFCRQLGGSYEISTEGYICVIRMHENETGR